MPLLITEYLKEHDLYMAIPVTDGRPDEDIEFMFADEESMAEFIKAYFRNPICAMYAYHAVVNGTYRTAEAAYV